MYVERHPYAMALHSYIYIHSCRFVTSACRECMHARTLWVDLCILRCSPLMVFKTVSFINAICNWWSWLAKHLSAFGILVQGNHLNIKRTECILHNWKNIWGVIKKVVNFFGKKRLLIGICKTHYLWDEDKPHDECRSYEEPTRKESTVLVAVIIQCVHR